MYNEDSDNSNNKSYYNDENNSSRETQNIKISQPELTIQPANLPAISNNIPPATVTWWRQIVKRQNQPNRFDIYYFPKETNIRLRSVREAKQYCEDNNIFYDSDLIDFSIRNKFQGVIHSKENLHSSQIVSVSDDESPSTLATKTDHIWLEVEIPKTFNQAIKSPQSQNWQQSMQK